MRPFVWSWILVVPVFSSSLLSAQDRERSVARATSASSNDESIIRANVAAFVKAYNAGDAKLVASLFAPEAQVIDEDGKTSLGRDAIEKEFAGNFAESPKARIRVDIESIRFVGSGLAIETGRAKTTEPGENPDITRYLAVHVKTPGGNWQLGFVRDTKGADVPNYERLKPLAWLIGDWMDESPESIVTTSCKWSENKNFILQDIAIRKQGNEIMHLSQRIGWDPLTKQIKSWLFDSEGGYGESFWTPDGNRWLVKATAVRKDGTTGSMTNIYTLQGKDSYTWRTTDRIIGGDVLPPVEVKVVRKPPESMLK
jgi:uncharacterized protein (TIGR02246 family)